jgi:sugar/nucleoside kinase (ribokinase family)
VAVDDLVYVDRFPMPGTKIKVTTRKREGGGLAGTALVAAAKLGARAAWAGVLGDDSDEPSRFTIEQFQQADVDCSLIKRQPDARPNRCVIVVEQPSGQRTILSCSEGATPFPMEDITEELIGQCKVLFVDHTVVETGTRAAQFARKQSIPVVGDIERHDGNGVAELLRLVDHLIIGIEAARRLTGQNGPHAILKRLADPNRACIVVTDGHRGCWYAERGGKIHHQPAFEVNVVDTTGCGDVFHGAYAAMLAQGLSIGQCIVIATATAAMKAAQPGGRAGIPDRAAVDAFIAEAEQKKMMAQMQTIEAQRTRR